MNNVLETGDCLYRYKHVSTRPYPLWMAESCVALPVAGYENEFVDSIPDTLSCPVCLLPFRDPHLVSCCGAKFCEPCIGRVKAAGQPCPLCKQEFNTMLDRSFQRKVLELKVRCSKKNDGCQWAGELRHVVPHEREECGRAMVECSYQCGAHLPRRLMAGHEHDMCPRRPMDVKLECFMRLMETKLTTERERHERELSAVKEELRRERDAHTIEIAELKQLLEGKMTEQKKETERKMAELTESKMAEQKKQMKVHTIVQYIVYAIFTQLLLIIITYRMSMLLKQR